MNKFLATALVAVLVTGCASHPDKLEPVYVSPEKYESLSCDAISQEMTRISVRMSDLYGRLKVARQRDNVQTGVGLIPTLWPVLLLLEGGDGVEADEFSRLKGEFSALDKAAITAQCDRSQLPANPLHKMEETITESNKVEQAPAKVESDDLGTY